MKKRCEILKLILLFLCLALPTILAAQELVKGVVLDKAGETLIGVAVRVKGNEKTGTITDLDGKFAITVAKKTDVLTFTYMGYTPLEQQAKVGSVMSIVMEEESKFLDEIVVIGYQNVRRRDLTGAVGKANIEDMLKTPVSSFDQALAGRLAGVQVSSGEGGPGGTMNIVIRGNNSLTQDNSPLYVIDGFITEDPAAGASINPNDIESIDVLKDASASAIYGSRGANGVILITTKKGRVGQLQVSYDFNAGVQWVPNKIEMMDAYEFVKLQSEMRPGDMSGTSGYFQNHNGHQYTLEDYRNVPQYDWQDMIFKDAWQQSHNIRLTGGTSEARYNASVMYFDQDGVVINSNYNKIQGTLGTNLRKGKLNTNLSLTFNKGVQTGNSPSQSSHSGMNNLFYSVWGYRPVTQPSVNLNSLLNNIRDESVDEANDYRFNPIMSLQNDYRKNETTFIRFNGFVEYPIIKDLTVKVSGIYSSDKRRNETFNNSKTRYGYPGSVTGVNATLFTSEKQSWINENTISYRTRIGKKHNVNGVAGITFEGSEIKVNSLKTIQIPFEKLGMAGMRDGILLESVSNIAEETGMSMFGRFNYDYASKYYFTATFRADGSSKFRKDDRWGYFPSLSAGWTFTEENFMESVKGVLNSGKLRAGWGQLGNNRIGANDRFFILEQRRTLSGDYTQGNGVAHGVYPIGGSANSVGVVPTRLGNEKLKWETTEQTNIGLDLVFLKDRLTLTADWYQKDTKDLLLFTDIPLSSGYGAVMNNIGKVRNTGLEFTLSSVNVKTKDFTWTTNFNIAFNKNEVMQLSDGMDSKLTNAPFDQKFNGTPSYIAKVGQPIGMMYGYIYEGTHKLDEFQQVGSNYTLKPGIPTYAGMSNTQPGNPKYKDLNGDGIIDSNDRTVIGRGAPKHIGGFTNNFEYKNFDLSVFLQWSYGNDVLNANKLMFESSFNTKKELNQFASYADRWTFDNPTSNIPVASTAASNSVFSSRLIEDGSYLRVKNITFGYTIPAKQLKKVKLNSARVYVSAQNLITFTSYSGYDPEVSIRDGALTPGLDFSAYPRATSFHFGINVGF